MLFWEIGRHLSTWHSKLQRAIHIRVGAVKEGRKGKQEMFYSITGLRAKRLHFMEEFFFQPDRIIASEMQSDFGPAQF